MSYEILLHLSTRTRHHCESCGEKATVQLKDKSTWCAACDSAARKNGY